jgi:hypothetical protein
MATAALQLVSNGLTSNDAAVLSALFDPESSSSSSISISKTVTSLQHIPDSDVSNLRRRETDAIKSLDVDSPSQSSIESAISKLSHLIAEYPKYAPAYLNRAQATRLLIGEENELFIPQNSDLIISVFHDLDNAIIIGSPVSPSDSLSELQASILSKAHTHRGYLLLRASQAVHNKAVPILPAELSGMRSEELEGMASKDFFQGGRHGNKIARELSVKTNPYAKMCGAIVQEAMRKEREEYQTGSGGKY